MRWFFAVGLLLLSGVTGCGVYTFNPKGKSDIQSVAIERFENKTTEYGLADQMTDLVIDAFIADGNLKVVSAANADAILSGTLTGYQRIPAQYDENDNVTQYAVQMDFDIALIDPKKDADIWKQPMSQKGYYDPATQTEDDGRREAIKLLIQDIINKTTKSW